VSYTVEQIRHRVAQLGPWFHNLSLDGVKTAPDHFLGDYPAIKWASFQHIVPEDLSGASVLDIGCNGGFYAIEMKRRGADRVLAIDSDPFYLEQAKFAAEVCATPIEFRRLNVYQVAEIGEKFDLVLFMGVLYHLRHPLLALDLLYDHVVADRMIFQSMQRGDKSSPPLQTDYPFEERDIFRQPGYPAMYFVEKCYSHDPTNWWIPNQAGVEAMLRSSGFTILNHPEEEVYLCGRGQREWSE
jgi:tRNA (mo5U34)-methyltransferase